MKGFQAKKRKNGIFLIRTYVNLALSGNPGAVPVTGAGKMTCLCKCPHDSRDRPSSTTAAPHYCCTQTSLQDNRVSQDAVPVTGAVPVPVAGEVAGRITGLCKCPHDSRDSPYSTPPAPHCYCIQTSLKDKTVTPAELSPD